MKLLYSQIFFRNPWFLGLTLAEFEDMLDRMILDVKSRRLREPQNREVH